MQTNQGNTKQQLHNQSKQNFVVVKQGIQTKLCNYADNYYGDQQCYIVSSQHS